MPSQLINNAIEGTSQAVLGKLPKNYVIAKAVNRARNELNQAPPDPQNCIELVIPDLYKQYNGETFLLIDTGADNPDPERIIVFGRESYQDWSHQVEKLYMDGTFVVKFNLVVF